MAARAYWQGQIRLALVSIPVEVYAATKSGATRAIMADLRAGAGGLMGGPRPFARADRSRFLQALDGALVRLGWG